MNKLKAVSGIYKIACGNYYYIGSAVNLQARKARHLHDLRLGKHCNSKLQNVYNKYGSNIVFSCIEEVAAVDLISREQYWFDTLDVTASNCLNVCKKAGSTLGQAVWTGRTHTEATKKLMRSNASLLGKKGSVHPVSVKVVQYDLKGNFIKLWGSAKEAADSIGVDSTNIIACCKGKRKSRKNYQWRYYSSKYKNCIGEVFRDKRHLNFNSKKV